MRPAAFKKIIWEYYRKAGRQLPWRKTRDPYKILVSEVMLQQTQASRVVPKYISFLKYFPTVQSLASAPLSAVLSEWQGLGYNRRAKYLKQCAEKVVAEYNGRFPKDFKALTALPGIGPATAGDILAFAWNIPVPVIETNIRSVYLHFFFPAAKTGAKKIPDTDILPLVEKIFDRENPREWIWALFDYGAYLKQSGNPSRGSTHYAKQSAFKGSNRELRSHILKLLLEKPRAKNEIVMLLGNQERVLKNLLALQREGMIKCKAKIFEI